MTIKTRALLPADERGHFRSGNDDLDRFFHRFAGQNQFRHHIGVTYVAVEAGEIMGFVTVTPAEILVEDLPSDKKQVPVLVLSIFACAFNYDAHSAEF